MAIKAPPSLIPACQAAIIMAAGIMKMALQWVLPEEEDLLLNLTKIKGTARNTISNHMINRGERASKITNNSHTPQAKGKVKITITMMVVRMNNNTITKNMEEFTVPHHKVILMLRRVKMTRLLLKLIKMKLYKKLKIRPRIKSKIPSCKRKVSSRIKISSQYNKKVL